MIIYTSPYQSQARPGSPVFESPQIFDQQVAISQDDIKSLADSVRALVVQLSSAGMGQCPRKIPISWTLFWTCPIQVSYPNIPLYFVIIKDSN